VNNVSKNQQKIEERKLEQESFLQERKDFQFELFEHNFNQAKKVYEANKDQVTAEEREKIEAEISRTEKQIAEYHEMNPKNLLP